ncbi:hypothetical protein, partial [Streptomyces sp. NPDC007346]|uniref:hypothetical protein n=1 Tax=Streptomyces sp. NPDC007346 TaxID=3154682 RepID=UPI00345551CA
MAGLLVLEGGGQGVPGGSGPDVPQEAKRRTGRAACASAAIYLQCSFPGFAVWVERAACLSQTTLALDGGCA